MKKLFKFIWIVLNPIIIISIYLLVKDISFFESWMKWGIMLLFPLSFNFIMFMIWVNKYSSINYDVKKQKLTQKLIDEYIQEDKYSKESVFDQCYCFKNI